MKKLAVLLLFFSIHASADTWYCDISDTDILSIKVNAKETESITRHKLNSEVGTMSQTVIFKNSPAIRGGFEVSHCRIDDHNSYLPESKYYYISSLCTSKTDQQPISISADFNKESGGEIAVRTLSSYYTLKFANCSALPF